MSRAGEKRPRLGDESGQSTIEFALSAIFLVSFIFFFFQLSLVLAFGNYAHYATFMAARAYLAAGSTPEDQEQRARAVIVQTLRRSEGQPGVDRLPTVARSLGTGEMAGVEFNAPQFDPDDRSLSWLQGIRYSFRSRIFLLPFGQPLSSRADKEAAALTLRSESWLGREPAFSECAGDLKRRNERGFFDNGC